jgi:preprotein translocase subunit SecY
MKQLKAIFSIPELRLKILITLAFLAIYRIGYWVPLPFVDQEKAQLAMQGAQGGALGQILGYMSMLGGGSANQATIFALGIMPYISASIIFQLLGSFYPPLEKLQNEGQSGQKKINEYTRYATVAICVFQALLQVVMPIMRSKNLGGYEWYVEGYNGPLYWVTGTIILTAGTIFLMWVGEQIDEYGIGNGISLIIMAGIVARIPDATASLLYENGHLRNTVFTLGGGTGHDITLEKLIVLVCLFVFVVVAVIAITKGQRRIPTQSAKHVRGRRVYGGTRQFLPLKVNQAGVMPVIFAGSLLMLPMLVVTTLVRQTDWRWVLLLNESFMRQGFIYNVFYIALIYFFCYFWTAITFNPKKMADNLKDYGSFIPGYRPGKRTAEYLERVMQRITYVGAAFLAVVAVIPTVISTGLEVNYRVAQFYGGTGLLIVISVALDLVQKINSHLVMRNYPGLTED